MPIQSRETTLILASTSPYRRDLLERLGVAFETAAPRVDETPLSGESPDELVRRLARAKAAAVAAPDGASVVIGSDQVAVCDGQVIGKPGSVERAREQLRLFSGHSVRFLTAWALLGRPAERWVEGSVETEVVFRALDDDEIDRYIALDQPLDCAGSFKSERAGLALLRRMTSDDPTALIGLPLIEVAAALRAFGFQVP